MAMASKLRWVLISSVMFVTFLVVNTERTDSPGLVDRITGPFKRGFGGDEDSIEHTNEYHRMEHGRLSSPRELLRGVGNTVSRGVEKVKETLGFEASNETTGLDCDKSFFSGVSDKFKEKIRAIYPGTKWCGDGNKADDYEDLGEYYLTDQCCREHDNCAVNIEAGETKFGLVNTGLFTRSHCDCDTKFYDCLKNASTLVSKQIGTTYFTVIGPQCFKESREVLKCDESSYGKCVNYRIASNGDKFYQWFDTPNF